MDQGKNKSRSKPARLSGRLRIDDGAKPAGGESDKQKITVPIPKELGWIPLELPSLRWLQEAESAADGSGA